MANGNGYSAGNLEFSVQQISNKTISSLDTLISKLQTVVSLLGNVSSLSNSLGTTINGTTRGSASSNLSKQKASAALTKGVKNDINQIAKSVKKMSSSSFTDIVNKVYFWHNYTKQIFRTGINIVKNAVEYTETLNLWQVAMRGNTEEAEEFIKTMNKAYGIATQTLMQYQAIFKNMLSSLGGLTSDTSYALSEYLTQMALDYASLYNVSIEKAMTTFQSVLSGQVRPIRSIAGYDITETTIYQLYQQLGGTKTMRQLSQTEKRLLRIYAVFQQMESSGAIGDLGKTMESTANQWRVFTEAGKELLTWLGILVEHYIRPILPYINAFVITLTNVVKKIAELNNIKPQEFGLAESMKETNEEVDELQGKLLGFDKFSVLGESGEENFGIDSKLLAGFSKYESVLSKVKSKAHELAEEWTALLIDPKTGKWTDKALEIQQIISDIASGLGILLGFKLSKKLTGLLLPLKDIGNLMKLAFGSWKSFGLTALITTLGYLYATNEDFRESINKIVSTLASTLSPILKSIAPILTTFANAISSMVTKLSDLGLLEPLLVTLLIYLGSKGLVGIIGKLPGLFKGVFSILPNIVKTSLGQIWNWLGKTDKSVFQLSGTLNKSKGSWAAMTNGAKLASVAMGGLLAVTLYSGLNAWFGTMDSQTKIIVGALTTLIAVLGAAAIAWMAFHGSMSAGIAIPVILGAVGAGAAGLKAIIDGATQFKTGGLVEDGLFQMSRGELVGEFNDGTTIVANNQQIIEGIKQGVYTAVRSAMGNSAGGDVVINIDSRELARATASANASALSNKYRVDFKPR